MSGPDPEQESAEPAPQPPGGPEATEPVQLPPEARRSLARTVRAGFALLAVLVLLGGIVGGVAFSRLVSTRSELVSRYDPALAESQRVLAALFDQDAGARGYALVADEVFLQRFEQGRDVQEASLDELIDLVGGTGMRGELEAFERRIDDWRNATVEPFVAAVQETGELPPELLYESRAELQELRAAFGEIEASIVERRRELVDDIERLNTIVIAVLLGALAGLVVYAAIVWRATRSLVLQPVDRLRNDAVAVSWGDLDHRVEPTGPRELAEVGAAVEEMRQRIRGDLAIVEGARAELEQYADELARSNRDLEQFAYVASHDLQEPLRKVSSFCQLLQKRYAGQLDERADQYIDFAVDGAKRMQGLINDLLLFSRVGRTTDRFEDVPLDRQLDRVLADLEERLEETGGRVVRPAELPTVEGDPNLLGTLLLNLVGNAVKFRAEEPPVVEITATPAGPDGEPTSDPDRGGAPAWLFCVSDNGIGIEPEYAERVFVIFQRLHGRDRYEGTGIGLALCKKIVEFHGGRIWVEPSDGPGTTICWTLPERQPERRLE